MLNKRGISVCGVVRERNLPDTDKLIREIFGRNLKKIELYYSGHEFQDWLMANEKLGWDLLLIGAPSQDLESLPLPPTEIMKEQLQELPNIKGLFIVDEDSSTITSLTNGDRTNADLLAELISKNELYVRSNGQFEQVNNLAETMSGFLYKKSPEARQRLIEAMQAMQREFPNRIAIAQTREEVRMKIQELGLILS